MQTARIFYEMMQHLPPGGPLVQIVSVGPGTCTSGSFALASSVVILRNAGQSRRQHFWPKPTRRPIESTRRTHAVQTSAFVFEPLSSLRAPSRLCCSSVTWRDRAGDGSARTVTCVIRARAPWRRARRASSGLPSHTNAHLLQLPLLHLHAISEGGGSRGGDGFWGAGEPVEASSSGDSPPPAPFQYAGPNWRGVLRPRARRRLEGA